MRVQRPSEAEMMGIRTRMGTAEDEVVVVDDAMTVGDDAPAEGQE